MFSRYFHIPSWSYGVAQERDAGVYDVSPKIILISQWIPAFNQSVMFVISLKTRFILNLIKVSLLIN